MLENHPHKILRNFALLLVWFYSISTFVGYFIPNPFLSPETVLFQAIQFSISTLFSSISFIDKTLSDVTTSGQSGPGGDGNKGVLHITQSPSITGISPSNCFLSYTGHSLEESYPSAEMRLKGPQRLRKKWWELKIRRKIEIIQTTSLLISARILRKVLEI